MGIPSYFSHVVKQHRRIVKKYDKKHMAIHNLYMDCNSLIYDAVRDMEGNRDKKGFTSSNSFESGLIRTVCAKIVEYVRLLEPKHRVYIAFDGVAPVAKLDQQRNRRYKTGYQTRILSKVGVAPPSEAWNTAAITPGTEFMGKLGEAVSRRFARPSEFGLEKLIVSASCEVGEGEHKIYDYIRKNPGHHKNTTTVIYGLDADLIMLTLNHLHIAPKMLLYRETPHFISSIDRTLSPNESYLLDIPLFGEVLARELNDNKEPDTVQKRNRVFDYIFLCFFLGNDFLPHFPALNIRTTGIDRLLSAYRKVVGTTNENLVCGTNIVWKNVRKLIRELGDHEETMMKEEYAIRNKQSKGLIHRRMEPEEAFMSIPLLDRGEEFYINPYESGWEERYYTTLFDMRIDDERRKQISVNYLEGLEWTLKYYTEGCVDWRWTYKYDYPPLLGDLMRHIPYFDTNMVAKSDARAVSEYVQLSYVLPGASLGLLPKPIETALRDTYPECYADQHEFCWAFCKYFWEAHAHMPRLEIEALEALHRQYEKHEKHEKHEKKQKII
jgi:5'-3' exonuclease